MASKALYYTVLYGVASYIEANLHTYLDEVETAVGASLSLPVPAESVFGYRDFQNAHHYPIACYVPDYDNPEQSGIAAVKIVPRMAVLLGIVGLDPEKLENQLMGYADAYLDLVTKNPTMGGLVDDCSIESVNFGHGALGDKSAASLVIELTMNEEESIR